LLKVDNVRVKYAGAVLALSNVSLELGEGQVVAVLGANGAGKSTTLKAISGLLKVEQGKVIEGTIDFRGTRIDNRGPEEVRRMGIAQVLEGRGVCEQLTTEENLKAGAILRVDRAEIRKDLETVYQYFPKLKNLRHRPSGYLSGGEQQMLALGRALMARPKVMLLDEPSLGLAPNLVKEIFRIIAQINADQGVSILLVEQNAVAALSIAGFGYVLENGRVVLSGPAQALKQNQDVRKFYLGLGELGGRKSYREVKHYKRRKRWLG